MDTLAALSRIPVFGALPADAARRLADVSGLQRIGRGSTIFCEGERPHFLYALIEGRVALLAGREGGVATVDFLGAGDLLLIAPALLDLPYMATGRASTDVMALLTPAGEFRRLAETELGLAVAINRMLADHWRQLLKHLKQIHLGDADTRVAQYLLDSLRPGARRAMVTLPGSRRELAAHLGITPETLSRSFRRLAQRGVTSRGSTIAIESAAKLAAFVGSGGGQMQKPSSRSGSGRGSGWRP
ncbi:MAG TPA: helix-turn-helix domain-containing protein [Rhizomicrobium sp.]|nr:helix-turn-helix domain-containing protein [Rhizomicrobium sp.]